MLVVTLVRISAIPRAQPMADIHTRHTRSDNNFARNAAEQEITD